MFQALVRILIGISGGALMLVGILIFAEPARLAGEFGLIAQGGLGLGTIRGDFAGFFLLSGGCAVVGAVRKAPKLLLVPLALMGCALLGRLLTAASAGVDAQSVRYMIIEGLNVALLLIGRAVLNRSRAKRG